MRTTTEAIWIEYHKELEGFIRSKVKDADLSKDILQDVFTKVHAQLHTIKDQDKILAWVYSITRNTITDHFRQQRTFVDANDVELCDELPINYNKPFAHCLNSFVKHLPSKYQEAISKVEYGQMSQHEFAKLLSISYSGAKSRVQRAKELLRSYFIQCCNVSTDKYGNIVGLKNKNRCGICEI